MIDCLNTYNTKYYLILRITEYNVLRSIVVRSSSIKFIYINIVVEFNT